MQSSGELFLTSRNLKKWAGALVCSSLLVTIGVTNLHAEVISNFESPNHGWSYYGGAEFPGAKGGLQVASEGKGEGGKSLKLSGNFTKGGAYVAAQKVLEPTRLKELRFWVKSPDLNSIGVRLWDKTGQCFQHTISVERSENWQQVLLKDFVKSAKSWGGANDGVFHQPATKMMVVIGGGPDKKSSLLIDQVEGENLGLEEPWSAKTPARQSNPPLILSCTQEDSMKKWAASGHLKNNSKLRNKITFQPGAFEGKDAVLVEVTHPRILKELLDFSLSKIENGNVWAERGYDYLSFWYKTDDADGEIYINLKGQSGQYASRVTVKPGGWTQVVLPFDGFYSTNYAPWRPYKQLQGVGGINVISIVSDANSLRGPGKILMADFQVASYSRSESFRQTNLDPLNLTHGWKAKAATVNEAIQQITDENADGSGWSEVTGESKWGTLKFGGGNDSIWLRNQVFIPEEWKGVPLVFKGAEALNCSLWWNGKPVDAGTFSRPVFPNRVIPADIIRWGAVNTIVLRVHRDKTWQNDGDLVLGQISLQPELCLLTLRPAGGTVEQERLPARFDMGTSPPASIELVFRFPEQLVPEPSATVSYGGTDFYFRPLAFGQKQLGASRTGDREVVVSLDKEDIRKLFFSEFFEYNIRVEDAKGAIPIAKMERVTDLCYASRDVKRLPPLPEQWEETSYGRLKLVDEIDCSLDIAESEHPYKEGGVSWNRWVLRKYNYFWQNGVNVEEILGKKARIASNSNWFGYRIGRDLEPGKTYLLRVEYPEDKPRYVPMDINLSDNYTCPGFRTGVSEKDPFDNFPLSGNYQHYDNFVSPDSRTYGHLPHWTHGGNTYKSHDTVPVANGFWVFFLDVGGHARSYPKSQFAGPAVSKIKLYEVDPVKNAPQINKPQGLPERTLMMSWEREPACEPMMTVNIAKLMGWNAISPEVMKWHFVAYWPTELFQQQDPEIPFKPLPEGVKMNTYKEFLDAAESAGIYLIPRIEYGGSNSLPPEARCVGSDGKPAKMARFCAWGANLLHPATWEDYGKLIDEVIGGYISNYSCLKKGMLWRMRCGRMTISYSRHDIELFCRENSIPVPEGDDKALRKWASADPTGNQYEAWWQKKRMEFNVKVRDKLRSINPDLKLFYYNWDQDGWALGGFDPRNEEEWALLYDNETKHWLYEQELATYAKYKNSDFVDKVKNLKPPIQKAMMEHYRDVEGISYSAPVCLQYVANNPEYLNYFKTGDGLAVDHQVLYEETVAYYNQHGTYEGSMITSGGPDFTMAPELWAWFYGDANTLSFSAYTFGRGFADAHRRFAQAFLALPDIKGQEIDQGDEDIKVRIYPSKNGTYVGVASKAYKPKDFTVQLPAGKGTKIKNLVTNREVPSSINSGAIEFPVQSGPMEMNAFIIE